MVRLKYVEADPGLDNPIAPGWDWPAGNPGNFKRPIPLEFSISPITELKSGGKKSGHLQLDIARWEDLEDSLNLTFWTSPATNTMSDSDANPFTIDNIPFGVISSVDNPAPRCATALNQDAIDLSALENDGFFDAIPGFGDGIIFSKVNILEA